MKERTISRSTFRPASRILVSLTLLAFILTAAPPFLLCLNASAGEVVPPEVGQLDKLEKRVRSCVAQAKKSSSLSVGDRDKLQSLYTSAHAKYSLWMSSVTTAIRAGIRSVRDASGDSKGLADAPRYGRLSKEAADAVKDVAEFCAANNLGRPLHAEEFNLPEEEAGRWMPRFFSVTGVSIWRWYAPLPLKKRKSGLLMFRAFASWSSWKDISPGGTL